MLIANLRPEDATYQLPSDVKEVLRIAEVVSKLELPDGVSLDLVFKAAIQVHFQNVINPKFEW